MAGKREERGEGGGKRERERERDIILLPPSQGPSDFNLRCPNGDSMLMVAAQFAGVDVLRFLIESARSCQASELISPDQTPAIHKLVHSTHSLLTQCLPDCCTYMYMGLCGLAWSGGFVVVYVV